jgi:Eukaryotic porin
MLTEHVEQQQQPFSRVFLDKEWISDRIVTRRKSFGMHNPNPDSGFAISIPTEENLTSRRRHLQIHSLPRPTQSSSLGYIQTMDTGEKPTMESSSPPDPQSSSSMLSFNSLSLRNLVPQFIQDSYSRVSNWRNRLGLQNPGTSENLHKEVMRDVFLTNHMFSGMRADLGKSFSANPLFQIQHSFSAGSSQVAPWSFLSMYSTDNVSLYLRD